MDEGMIVSTSSPEETMDLGRRLARWFEPPEIRLI